MTDLITEARELSAIDIEKQPIKAEVIIDELCDALEKAQGNLDAVWDMYQSAERELKKVQEQIERVHKALDFAETQRQRSENYTELAINNGLALGRIAVILQHDFEPLPAPPEEGE